MSHPLENLWEPFWVHLGVPKWPPKWKNYHKKTVFWLFWTISPKRMGLISRFEFIHWAVRSAHLWTFGYLFRSIWGCPIGHKMGDKTNLKPVFWLFQTIFPKRMGKKAPNQIIRPIFLREIVHNNEKTGFYAVFFILGPFGHPQMNPKKVLKGPQVGRTYGPMSQLKNKPLSKLLGPFF